ncbi:MAG TPA: isopentenyl transferase family protein, partial [Fibrella sp.]
MLVILGPTASGKTHLAVQMAHQLISEGRPAEIISADSRQVYRGMDVGTGKDLSEYSIDGLAIPYHLIDIVEAGEAYNVFRYQQDFDRVLQDILARGAVPILCGGSGLYIEAALRPDAMLAIPPDDELRSELE